MPPAAKSMEPLCFRPDLSLPGVAVSTRTTAVITQDLLPALAIRNFDMEGILQRPGYTWLPVAPSSACASHEAASMGLCGRQR